MKLYNALIKKSEEGKISEIILIKEGFSFFAFLFGPLWFFYHKMWKEALTLIVVDAFFGLYSNIAGFPNEILLQISFAIIVAVNANFWLCAHLLRKKYIFSGLFFADDQASAMLVLSKNLANSSFDESILNS